MEPFWLALILAAALVWAVWMYNRLVRLKNQVLTAWSDIDVQLTRRHDLVPELVSTVRAYAGHERALLESVTELRSRAMDTDRPRALAAVEGELEQALARLLVLKESYPQLKADANFAQLAADLVDTEDQLQYARRFYNGAVRDLNNRIRQFPDLLVARPLGFREAEFYRAEDHHRPNTPVDLEQAS